MSYTHPQHMLPAPTCKPSQQRTNSQPLCPSQPHTRNATLRSKAESKTRTLLGIYGRMVLDQKGLTSLDLFWQAVEMYKRNNNGEPLEAIQVCVCVRDR